MRRVIGTVMVAAVGLGLAACDDDGATEEGAAAAIPLGRWERVWPPSPLAIYPSQRLEMQGGDRYVLVVGGGAVQLPPGVIPVGLWEFGVVRAGQDGLRWFVDSIVDVRLVTATDYRRTVERRPIFIEAHPFDGARVRRSGDDLVLDGTNVATGTPDNFEARFRRLP